MAVWWACVLVTVRLRSTIQPSSRLTPCVASRSHTAPHTCTLQAMFAQPSDARGLRTQSVMYTCTLRPPAPTLCRCPLHLLAAPHCSSCLPHFMPPHTSCCPILHFRAPTSCTRWWRRVTPSARLPRSSTPSATSSSSSSGAGERVAQWQQKVVKGCGRQQKAAKTEGGIGLQHTAEAESGKIAECSGSRRQQRIAGGSGSRR